ncbi:DUF1206 domain-containing protein [Aeromicrobium sp. CF3.5]|uniref:DUF1206 domain-containing protein n=1 Tax=Aeromicrobium sp. CF3.5 TaxID=3373078 RepID=UPI003EE50328
MEATDVDDTVTLQAGARVGLVAYGVVHLLIAVIAAQVAWSGSGQDASAGGALKTLAGQPFGAVVLWITVIGLAALAVWQITEAIWGHRGNEGATLWRKRAQSVGRAVIYLALTITSGRIAIGSGGSSGSGSSEEAATARLMSVPFGRTLVGVVSVVILVIAARQVWRGITSSFTQDLAPGATIGPSGRAIERIGTVGWAAKGIALGIIGALFAWAAITFDPDKAGGLDDALKTLRDQPFGPYLLSLVAAGLATFGLYCFAWSRHLD